MGRISFSEVKRDVQDLSPLLMWTTFDETHLFLPTVVRMTFNRPLTFSERETFYHRIREMSGYQNHSFIEPDVVTIKAYIGSRLLSQYVSDLVEAEFLNVHPRAAYTIQPRVKV